MDVLEHSDECERHHAEHLDDSEPGAADCICSVESGDPEDDDEVTRLRRQLAGAVEALRAIHHDAKYLAEGAWTEEGSRLVGEKFVKLAAPFVGGQ